jgi:hypothetical protein
MKAVEAMKKRILGFFDTPDPVSDPWTEKLTPRDLDVAAKAACALEKFIEKRNLDGLAYYYEGGKGSVTRELVTNFIVGNSLLTAAGFPMCGEFDLKNCVAMMIFDRLDIGGSFAEFHPIDFERGTVLVGHDGPHHLNIAAKTFAWCGNHYVSSFLIRIDNPRRAQNNVPVSHRRAAELTHLTTHRILQTVIQLIPAPTLWGKLKYSVKTSPKKPKPKPLLLSKTSKRVHLSKI